MRGVEVRVVWIVVTTIIIGINFQTIIMTKDRIIIVFCLLVYKNRRTLKKIIPIAKMMWKIMMIL